MDWTVERAEVWAAAIKDEPGGLADKLEAVAQAGADLAFVIARRQPDQPGAGVVFLTPLQGDAQTAAATGAGFTATDTLHSVRIEGPDKPGLVAQISRRLGEAGINLRGLSGAAVGSRFIGYLALDSADDADEAIRLLQQAE